MLGALGVSDSADARSKESSELGVEERLSTNDWRKEKNSTVLRCGGSGDGGEICKSMVSVRKREQSSSNKGDRERN